MSCTLRRCAAVGLTVVSWACGGDQDSSLEIRLRGSQTDSASLAGIELQIEGRRISAADFSSDESGLTEVTLQVPNSGLLVIHAQLWEHGQLIAEGEANWTMSSEYEWGMDVFRTSSDPTETCFGCLGSASFPVADWAVTEAGEALWFMWGGVPRDSGAVF